MTTGRRGPRVRNERGRRVVHLIGATIGGAELQLLGLLEAAVRDRSVVAGEAGVPGEAGVDGDGFEHRVVLINGGSLVERFRELCETTVIAKGSKVDMRFLVGLGKELRRARPALVHTWTETPNLWGPLVATVAVPRAAVVVAVVALEEWKGTLLRAADRVVFHLADRVVGCADAVTARAIARGAPAARTATVPLGVHLPVQPPPLPGTQTVLLLARFDYRKGHELLVRAMPAVVAACASARFVMSGPTFDAAEEQLRARVRELADELGVGDRLTITGPRAAADAMSDADVVVVPSSSEGLPNVLLEAFATARPVVATAVGGIPEVVRDGETGWLVPPGDLDAIARAIVAALRDPVEAARRAAAGREVAARRSFPHVLAEWYEQYRTVLAHRARPAFDRARSTLARAARPTPARAQGAAPAGSSTSRVPATDPGATR